MKRFLSVLLFGATGSVVLASNAVQNANTTVTQNTPQAPNGNLTVTQNTPQANSPQAPIEGSNSTPSPQPLGDGNNIPTSNSTNHHIAGLEKCLTDFTHKFDRAQCMRYTDIGYDCKKDANQDMSCENKRGLKIYVPLSEIKQEIDIKEKAGILHPGSRMVKAFGHHHKKEEKSEKESANLNPSQVSAVGPMVVEGSTLGAVSGSIPTSGSATLVEGSSTVVGSVAAAAGSVPAAAGSVQH